jgi:hypothetical protein
MEQMDVSQNISDQFYRLLIGIIWRKMVGSKVKKYLVGTRQ